MIKTVLSDYLITTILALSESGGFSGYSFLPCILDNPYMPPRFTEGRSSVCGLCRSASRQATTWHGRPMVCRPAHELYADEILIPKKRMLVMRTSTYLIWL